MKSVYIKFEFKREKNTTYLCLLCFTEVPVSFNQAPITTPQLLSIKEASNKKTQREMVT